MLRTSPAARMRKGEGEGGPQVRKGLFVLFVCSHQMQLQLSSVSRKLQLSFAQASLGMWLVNAC